MQENSQTFDINLSNIPTCNIRFEFVNDFNMLSDKKFRDQFRQHREPIKTPYLIWLDFPNKLLTYLVQKSIVGIESYLPGAIYYELGIRGKLKENIKYVKNPFSIKGTRGSANTYYNSLPSLLDKKIALINCNKEIYSQVKAFYKEIRNPLFHGKQLEKAEPEKVFKLFELMATIYEWIDLWHDPDNTMKGLKKICEKARTPKVVSS